MSIGNIKHKFSVAIESDNPESRGVGILKLANLFEQAGIHLAADLNASTSRLISAAANRDDVVNDTIVATLIESDAIAAFVKKPVIGHLPDGSTVVYRGMPGREMAGLYPVPYSSAGLRVVKNDEADAGGAPQKPVVDSLTRVEEILSEVVAGKTSAEHVKTATHMGGEISISDNIPPGNIPGYEHNPMAQSEYFKDVEAPATHVFLTANERFVPGNWPDPAPVGLVKFIAIAATDNYGTNSPNYEYTVVGFGKRTGWHLLKKISLLSHVDGDIGPNGVRVEDLLAICADHLTSMNTEGTLHPVKKEALKSIQKALNHLHGLTVMDHLMPAQADGGKN
jgi:hypothetical protein